MQSCCPGWANARSAPLAAGMLTAAPSGEVMYILDYTSTRSQQAEPDAALTSHSWLGGAARVSVPPTDGETTFYKTSEWHDTRRCRGLRHVPNKKTRRQLTGYNIVWEPNSEFPQVGVDISSDTGDDGDVDDYVTRGKKHTLETVRKAAWIIVSVTWARLKC